MNKLSKEKRNQLIMVLLGTVAVLVGLWFGLINWQQKYLDQFRESKVKMQDKLTQIQQAVKNTERLENDMQEATRKLAEAEEDMAPADPYAWMVSKMRLFRLPYKVDLPVIGLPEVKDTDLLPKFPYKQAAFRVDGTAYFHDLGKFIADFENHFPYIRVRNLNIDAQPTFDKDKGEKSDTEKLHFQADIVTLVKPS